LSNCKGAFIVPTQMGWGKRIQRGMSTISLARGRPVR